MTTSFNVMRPNVIQLVKVATFSCGVMLLIACSQHWQVRSSPTDAAVAEALTAQPDRSVLASTELNGFSSLAMPGDVRPCCAFGNAQKVKVGTLQVPFFRYANTLDANDIGAHAFDAGPFSYVKASPDGSRSGENNGQIYTRLGGFIDLAHVRDTADNTIILFYKIYKQLGKEVKIELPPEIGPRYIQLKSFNIEQLEPLQRWNLAADMAARLGYLMAESHEIAQWHGYRSWALWSEEVSAYSPEDIYSNMLGAKIAVALISNNLAMNQTLFNQHMNGWLTAAINKLEPVTAEQTDALFDVIDGDWWDSNEPLPNKFMLLKRHYALGDVQSPYLVDKKAAQAHAHWPLLAPLYQQDNEAKQLSLPRYSQGIDIDEVAKLWLFIDDKFKANFSHIPADMWSNGFTNEFFLALSAYNQIEDDKQLKAKRLSDKS
ncbi:DUF4056 domain-containing protein [Moritella sp. 5]|uniref:DUF4056 domain-containing protein n=1 Tax=Moritella sp. 5 TaxID=2746231 RepID=UPI002013C0CC|nr:DUF4056 domain-containing protein [Moritella sp. 5]